jgi:hypothetical protein
MAASKKARTRAKTAARKTAARKTAARKTATRRGAEITFPAKTTLPPGKIEVFDLKKGRRGLTVDELCEILRKVAKSKVGYIVRNSPFKRPRASEASLPSR